MLRPGGISEILKTGHRKVRRKYEKAITRSLSLAPKTTSRWRSAHHTPLERGRHENVLARRTEFTKLSRTVCGIKSASLPREQNSVLGQCPWTGFVFQNQTAAFRRAVVVDLTGFEPA